jgi:transcriptional regulator with XRE-family HTH domain
MTLGEKVRSLRAVEGELRRLGRDMSQQEVVRAMAGELGASLSQSYLSQVESGARPHLTHRTRDLFARFFKVHPGYLVTDPPGYQTELATPLRAGDGTVGDWLRRGAEQFADDPELAAALDKLAGQVDPRRYLLLLGLIADTPALADRLGAALGGSPAPERRAT